MRTTFKDTSLTDRSALLVSGLEARSFLHRLLSADIERLQDKEATYSALLSSQGKILFDFFVVFLRPEERSEELFILDCAVSQLDELEKRLKLYRLRTKAEVSSFASNEIFVSMSEPSVEAGFKYRDPRTPEMGWRSLVQKGSRIAVPGYHSARIGLGLADTDADLGSGEFFPHEANLEQLGAVSFEKGCYVGQEVVSRMEHRGMARSRILPVKLGGAAPAKGADIRAGGKPIGTLLSSSGSRALALLRLDRLAEAPEPLLTEGVSVQVLKPGWVRYDVPNSTSIP